MKKILVIILLVMLFYTCGCVSPGVSGRPLIGITSVYNEGEKTPGYVRVSFAYVKAIRQAGGLPVVLPTIEQKEILEQYVEKLDGLVLIGGRDVPPGAYGRKRHHTVKELHPKRYNFERQLIPLWFESGKPLLGICLGAQFTNVMRGGTLIQDIPSQVGDKVRHRVKGKLVYHQIAIEPDCLLAKILGVTETMVNSSHHQAVNDVGADLKAVSRTKDGMIEALERTDGAFGLFVQWHPERMEDTSHRNAIFGSLIRACTKSGASLQ